MNAIELCDVNKAYDNFALNHISFSVPKGCVVGLIGENVPRYEQKTLSIT